MQIKNETVRLGIHILSMFEFIFLAICVQVEKLQQIKDSLIVLDRSDKKSFYSVKWIKIYMKLQKKWMEQRKQYGIHDPFVFFHFTSLSLSLFFHPTKMYWLFSVVCIRETHSVCVCVLYGYVCQYIRTETSSCISFDVYSVHGYIDIARTHTHLSTGFRWS